VQNASPLPPFFDKKRQSPPQSGAVGMSFFDKKIALHSTKSSAFAFDKVDANDFVQAFDKVDVLAVRFFCQKKTCIK
jgi:hypothetical protein